MLYMYSYLEILNIIFKMKGTIVVALLVTAVLGHVQEPIRRGEIPCRGVNLGGWLVAEHWMTSSSVIWEGVPDDIANKGEHYTMQFHGHANGDWRFEQHRNTWITEQDIAEIASYGLNCVRVPVGYWIAGFDMTGGTDWQTYAPGALNHLDTLIKDWANKHNVAVLISIHAAKGSQNGNDHSAPPDAGKTYWSQYPENVQNTVDLAYFLAERYRHDAAFLGIGLLNEPAGSTDENVLKQYYVTAHDAIRWDGNDCVLSVSPLLWRQDASSFSDFAPYPRFSNMWHEWHKYVIWGYEGQNEDQIMWNAVNGITDQINAWHGNWLFVGEWSLATTGDAPFNDDGKFRQFADRYLESLSKTHAGWTYWTWKVSYDENGGRNAWSLRTLLRRGLFNFKQNDQQQ